MKGQMSRMMHPLWRACGYSLLMAGAAAWAASGSDSSPSASNGTAVSKVVAAEKPPALDPSQLPALLNQVAASVATPPLSNGEVSEDEAEAPDIHVSPEGIVEMHVRNLDLGAVLQMLSMQSKRNIIASKKTAGTVTANLYDVNFEQALTAILTSNGCKWQEQGNFIYVYTDEEWGELQAAGRPMISKVIRLSYADPENVKKMVSALKSKDGKIETCGDEDTTSGSGSSSGSSRSSSSSSSSSSGGSVNLDTTNMAGSTSLLIYDLPENVTAIEKAIAEVDVRPAQVLVEATILRAQLNEDNALGIDFNILGGVDFSALDGQSQGVTSMTLGNIPTGRLNDTNMTNRTDFSTTVPQGGYTFGLVKGSMDAFVRALEQITDVSVLANPKVLALDMQQGMVIVGRRDGYLTTTVTETAAVQQVDFLETGTQLTFIPTVSNDSFIRMAIQPKDSTGGINSSNLPYEQTTEVTTNIMVKDGHTILIGGLFRESTTASRNQVPLIGNVPVAGALFRSTRDITQREEVIILLTVHVIKEPERYCEESMAALQDVERYRVGMRKGVQWYGREQLAQAHYRWAMEHLAKGHRGQALWDLNLAVNNNPKFLAAIELKEQLVGEREWDEDGSSTRGFLSRLIMKEQGGVTPLFNRPGPPFSLPDMEGPKGFDEGEKCPTPAEPDGQSSRSENGEISGEPAGGNG